MTCVIAYCVDVVVERGASAVEWRVELEACVVDLGVLGPFRRNVESWIAANSPTLLCAGERSGESKY